MKSYLNSKKIIFTAVIISALITLGYFFTMTQFADVLNYESIVGILKPLGAFGICATVLSAFFLFFSQAVFISFLKRVAFWYLPVLLITVANTSVYSSNILSLDRSMVVLHGMVLLGLIAIVYAFVMRKRV